MTDRQAREFRAREFRDTARRAGERLTVAQSRVLVASVEARTVEEDVKAGRLPASITVRTLWPACDCCKGPESVDVMIAGRWLAMY